MSDTQWPRYEVFQQEKPARPFRNAGSIHAPDDEMALLIARDVFVRRPDCHSLWVVPAGRILSQTTQELAAAPAAQNDASGAPETFHVFQKKSQAGVETFVEYTGQVEAASLTSALAAAVLRWPEETAFVWWVFPESAVIRNDPAEADLLFSPARDKPFRKQTHYHVRTLLRAVKQKRREA